MRRAKRTDAKREQARALKRRVGNAELLALLYIVSTIAVLTAAIGRLLQTANAVCSRAENSVEVVLRPAPVSFYLIGGLVSFLIAFLTVERVHRRLLGPPPEFFDMNYAVAGLPYPRWLKRAMVICLAVACLVTVFNVRKHATIGSTLIVDQPALSVAPSRYPLKGVQSVEMARYHVAGSKYSAPHISHELVLFVKFEDGRIWSPLHSELYVADQGLLAEIVSSRSSRPISYPGEIEDLPDEAGVRQRSRIVVTVIGGSIALLVALWVASRHMKSRHGKT